MELQKKELTLLSNNELIIKGLEAIAAGILFFLVFYKTL